MMPDARFGRMQEGYGENPIVAAILGAAAVAGLQGANNGPESYSLPTKVCSLGKHFAACKPRGAFELTTASPPLAHSSHSSFYLPPV